ncbi:PKD domain-containing protein, partial [Thiotrichales bacterium HSG1]|nr:PKD domain-containing protein [Thiotrichales bacterium HSG1]
QRATVNLDVALSSERAATDEITITATSKTKSDVTSKTTIHAMVNAGEDSDGDGHPDVLDKFPDNADEWFDADNDGEGDNADIDDDNDGLTDKWEFDNDLSAYDASDVTDELLEKHAHDENKSPKSIFSITPNTGEVPLVVTLDGSTSTDTDGTIASYKWTASDGQTAEGQNAELIFTEAGDYTITLEVTDDKGATHSVTSNASATAPAVGEFRTSGTIRDDNGNPIAGVTIKIADKTVTTNENGYWEATGLFAGVHEVVATKDGYNFRSTTCALSIGQDCQPKLKSVSLLDVRVTSASTIKQGENITYTATITNNGDQAATGISFIDVLPIGTQLISITGPEGSNCNTDTISCTLADLEAGANATITIVVSNDQANRLANTVTLTSNEYPASVETKRSTVIPHLSVSLSDNSPTTIGGNLSYIATAKVSDISPTAMTGVKLAIQLPKGIDYQPIANCVIDDLLIATCDIGDMEIDSEATINVSGTITDGMLLSMIAIAKINDQTEVYTHTAKKTTKVHVPVDSDFKIDMCVALDITGSMSEEINGVKEATKKFVKDHLPADQSILMALVVFKDNVKVSALTRDANAFKEAVNKLKVSGGGDCKESSAIALHECAKYLKNEGVLLIATDAPSHATDAELDTVINTLVGKGIKPKYIWTQGCQAQ